MSGTTAGTRAGDPTFYIASDEGVALAEFARHFREREDPALGPLAIERACRLDVQVQAVLDLRQPAVRGALGLHGGARRFLDVEVARATANFVRRTTSAEALLIPSIAFLDDPVRWSLVLFLEKLPTDLSQFIRAAPHRYVPRCTVESILRGAMAQGRVYESSGWI